MLNWWIFSYLLAFKISCWAWKCFTTSGPGSSMLLIQKQCQALLTMSWLLYNQFFCYIQTFLYYHLNIVYMHVTPGECAIRFPLKIKLYASAHIYLTHSLLSVSPTLSFYLPFIYTYHFDITIPSFLKEYRLDTILFLFSTLILSNY